MSSQENIYDVENLEVRFANGDYITSLNIRLVKKQELSADTIEMLKMTHVMRAMIFKVMNNTDNVSILKRFARMFENLEYLQQELWGFKKDSNYHYWFEVPKCSCPSLDNRDCNGSEMKIIDLKCTIHGGEKG